jgi:hypothetical protein
MSFTVDDFHDLVRLLEQHPDWKAMLRQQMVGPELLALPDLVRQLTEAQLRTEQRLDTLTARVEELAAAQARTEQRLDTLTARVEELAAAQGRTEQRLDTLTARVEELAAAQVRTEQRLDTLTVAQVRTEQALRTLAETTEKLATGLGRTRQEVGSLSEIVGALTEDRGEQALLAALASGGFRLVGRPGPLALDGVGEIDVVVPVEDPNGQHFWAVLESRARLRRGDVAAWDRRLRDPEFRALLGNEGVTGPLLVYAFGVRIYRDAEEEGRTSGIGILGAHGEIVAPIPRNS